MTTCFVEIPKLTLQTWLVDRLPPEPEPGCWLHPDVEIGPSSIAQLGLFARATIAPGAIVSHGWPPRDGQGTTADLHRSRSATRSPIRGHDHRRRGPSPACPASPTTTATTAATQLMVGRRVHPGSPAAHRGRRRSHQRLRDQHRHHRLHRGLLLRIVTVPGIITGEDWRRPELQARYGDHWIPALLDRKPQA